MINITYFKGDCRKQSVVVGQVTIAAAVVRLMQNHLLAEANKLCHISAFLRGWGLAGSSSSSC